MVQRQVLKDWLLTNLYKDGKVNPARANQKWILLAGGQDIIDAIIAYSSIPSESKIYPHVYCIVNDILEVPRCPCGQPVSWHKRRFLTYCSKACANKHTAKHGAEAHICKPEVRAKCKETFIRKYGVDNPWKAKVVQQTIRETCVDKFDGPAPACCENVKEKMKQTCLERYGVEHYSKTEKARQDTIFRNQKHISPETLDKLANKDWCYDQHVIQKKTHCQIAREIGVCQWTVWNRLLDHGIETNHYFSVSATEEEIHEYLKSLGVTCSRNIRGIFGGQKELDFYLPEYNMAIEYNGIYYHTTQFVEPTHHLDKTKACLEKGIQLYHIREDEWQNKKDIWKSILANRLGKSISIYARNCSVVKLEYKPTAEFLNENHLQGTATTNINYGLVHNDELVAIMTFKRSRFSTQAGSELVRFCTKIGYKVVGGASKLFAKFVEANKPLSVVSYADRRYSNGGLYGNIGFQFSHFSNPNYQYFVKNRLESRQAWQKHKLKDKLPIVDLSLTEEENMRNNGYFRMYDCGNYVFYWKAL